ncbi:ParA family protein [Kitasatospora sp. NPDC127116]|uniref:ParA family protein n=1 Tax=Kitasatospora sp. NPDC127116 TaxID=3345367 RepID=UPI00363BBAFF
MSKTIPEWAAGDGRPPIVATAAYKGGDGKSTLARELAYLLDSVLIDFDWDLGGNTRSWGHRHEERVTAPLLDAFERGRTPRPLRGRRKADLVPSHPDWANQQPDRDTGTDALVKWVTEWKRPGVVDTHPGGCESTYAALNAANVIVVPAVYAKESLNALEGMCDELTDYPLLIIPYMVQAPPQWARRRLRDITRRYDVPVGPPVGYESWIPTRTLNMAISSEPVPMRARQFVSQMDRVVDAVINYA